MMDPQDYKVKLDLKGLRVQKVLKETLVLLDSRVKEEKPVHKASRVNQDLTDLKVAPGLQGHLGRSVHQENPAKLECLAVL